MSRAYYNEIDPKAAAWLRELIGQGHIAPGDVDERSILDVRPGDLAGYTQCHFFAGIGVWSYALRLAGWPDDRPVWTGSCPCQPFSQAGRGDGFADERHLWPAWFHLIGQCSPGVILGEQVASKDGLGWFDLVHADLEAAGYAVGAVDLCAAGVGAPHIRQRLWFVADADGGGQPGLAWSGGRPDEVRVAGGGAPGGLGQPDSGHPGRDAGASAQAQGGLAVRAVGDALGAPSAAGLLGDAERARREGQVEGHVPGAGRGREGRLVIEPGGKLVRGFWTGVEWLYCRDGKYRPTQPGLFPLAHGSPARVGRLRGYGNAIVAQAAQAFIEATGLI